jgi:hypothetical protein
MKVKTLNMIVKNDQFIDVLLDVSLTLDEIEYYQVQYAPLLCITYDKYAKSIIAGLLEGDELIFIDLTDEERDEINFFLYQNDIMDEVEEIALEICMQDAV